MILMLVISFGNTRMISQSRSKRQEARMKYYFEMEVEFYHTGPEETDQHTTARLYIPPMTLDVNELNLAKIVAQFRERLTVSAVRTVVGSYLR